MAAKCTSSPVERALGAGLHPPMRASRMGKWRAFALIAVHVLIALHIAHWLTTGKTISPLEPSEAMEFTKEGLVNAGLILFALAIASTLVLGRWFCGWACHVVALQDLCAWILRKLGLKPRPVRLGILGAVPWLVFVYMFLSPLVARWLAGGPAPQMHLALEKTDFLATFPDFLHTWKGQVVTVATLGVCGFGIVWLLGAKGFCTYGCPYGGIFGLADQLAPMRIHVTDACDSCGHCTATCGANVNVSHEVRTHGMVVDPGCMKHMDCISVCPKGALYIGFGKPAIAVALPKTKKRAGDVANWALVFAFYVGAFYVLHAYNGVFGAYVNAPSWKLILTLATGAFLVALVLRSRARAPREHTLGEEALLAAGFLVALYAFRGMHDWVPLLFGLGLSIGAAYLFVELVRLVRRSDLALQRLTLKRGGRWTGAGISFLALALIGLAGTGFAVAEQGDLRADARVRIAEMRAGAERAAELRERGADLRERYDAGVLAARAGRFEDAIAHFRAALAGDPGWLEARENLAGMLCAAGRFDEGAAEFERALEQNPADPHTRMLHADALAALGRAELARAELFRALDLAGDRPDLWPGLAARFEAAGEPAAARELRNRPPPR